MGHENAGTVPEVDLERRYSRDQDRQRFWPHALVCPPICIDFYREPQILDQVPRSTYLYTPGVLWFLSEGVEKLLWLYVGYHTMTGELSIGEFSVVFSSPGNLKARWRE